MRARNLALAGSLAIATATAATVAVVRTPLDLGQIAVISNLIFIGHKDTLGAGQWDLIDPPGERILSFRHSFDDSVTVLWILRATNEADPDTILRSFRYPMRTWNKAPPDTILLELEARP